MIFTKITTDYIEFSIFNFQNDSLYLTLYMLSGSNCIDIVDVTIFIILFNIFSLDFGKNCSGPPKYLAPPLRFSPPLNFGNFPGPLYKFFPKIFSPPPKTRGGADAMRGEKFKILSKLLPCCNLAK